jgi:hypothetical protein
MSAYDPKETLRLRFSKPVVQNGLVLHPIELGDLVKSHYLRFAIGLVRQELFQSSSDCARAIKIPPFGGTLGPDNKKRPAL